MDIKIKEENILTIDIANMLVKAQKDRFSSMAKQKPSGLLEPVNIYCYEQL